MLFGHKPGGGLHWDVSPKALGQMASLSDLIYILPNGQLFVNFPHWPETFLQVAHAPLHTQYLAHSRIQCSMQMTWRLLFFLCVHLLSLLLKSHFVTMTGTLAFITMMCKVFEFLLCARHYP